MTGKNRLIHSELPGGVSLGLIENIRKGLSLKEVYISSFARYGFSGAKQLLAYRAKKKRPVDAPYIIKVAKLENIQKEYRATIDVKPNFRDSNMLHGKIFSSRDRDSGVTWGALVFAHAGNSINWKEPMTLKSVIYGTPPWIPRHYGKGALPSDEVTVLTDAKLEKCFRSVFNKLDVPHKGHRWEKRSIVSLYKKYFRGRVGEKRLKIILGKNSDRMRFVFGEAEIHNPIKYFQRIVDSVNTPTGIVHGDLHTDNVVLDGHYDPTLIDFAWGHINRDILVDYVLMENTIRFNNFPRSIVLEEQRFVDEALLDYDGTSKVLSKSFNDRRIGQCYHRMAKAIKIIRGKAKDIIGSKLTGERYLLTQFLVLYGLIRYPDYDQIVATRALGLIAKRLADKRHFL